MIELRYVEFNDKDFWFSLDKHLSDSEFIRKVNNKEGFILIKDNEPIGLLRYSLFWDNIPFINMLYIKNEYQRNGYGKELMYFFENSMKNLGYGMILVSTQSNEEAQHFYRKIGYCDCGSLILSGEPLELILCKHI